MADDIFTPDEVERLAANQVGRAIHPFTCPNRGDGNHRVAYGDKGALVATTRGWICPFCDYTQNWAHHHMKAEFIPAYSPPASSSKRKE